jgi:hypothetical protein
VPTAIQLENGSSRTTALIAIVDSGPSIPACAATDAPTRSIAIITIRTGATVHAVPLSTDSQITGAATCAVDSGRRIANCAMHSTHATTLAEPTMRSEPSRATSRPL